MNVEYENIDSLVPCRVAYQKDGQVTYPAKASNTIGHCERVEADIVNNLRAGGYQCTTSLAGPDIKPNPRLELNLFATVTDEHSGFVADADLDELTQPALQSDTESNVSEGRYLIVSRAFDSAVLAHQHTALFKRIYPYVETRVAVDVETSAWHMVLGEQPSRARLHEAISLFDPQIQSELNLIKLDGDLSAKPTLTYRPDGWMPFVLLDCYNKGRTSTRSLSACAKLRVDVDTFAGCVGGGICQPEPFTRATDVEVVDLLATFGREKPADVARGMLLQQLDECRNKEGESEEFALCALSSLASPELVDLYECQQQSGDSLSLLRCAAGDDLVGQIDQLDSCTESEQAMAECVLSRSGQPELIQSAACLELEDTSRIASCAIENNLAMSESAVMDCLSDRAGADLATSGVGCLSEVYLPDKERAMLACVSESDDINNRSLCLARRSGQLEGQQLASLECMVAGDSANKAEMANCIGGPFLSDDIGACLEFGVSDARCFDPVSSVARAIENPGAALLGSTEVAELRELRNQIDAIAADPLDAIGVSGVLEDLQSDIDRMQDELVPERLDPTSGMADIADDAADALSNAAEKVKNRLGGLFGN